MFKIKRPAIIGLLLVLLVFTAYLNYQLTQQALLTASKEYQNYEMMEMENNEEFALGEDDDYIEIVDSVPANEDLAGEDKVEDVAEVVTTGNTELSELDVEASAGNRNYFVEYRLSRDKLRAGMVDRLNEIVKNTQTTEEVRSDAQKEIIKIGNISEKELQIEGLIKSKGFEEALVFLTDEDIKVVVSANELTEQDMVKILDIIKSETDFTSENIKIMKKQ